MKERDPVTIEPSEDGPYLVKNLGELRNSKGGEITVRKTVALCRCGRSSNKPFCDGTHAKEGFRSARQGGGPPDRRDDYAGERITIHDNRGICSHAGRCTDGLPQVWRMRVEPWIDPNAAEPEAIVETVRQCPSGALSYSVDGVEHRDQQRPARITVTKDGPLAVTGGIELTGASFGEGASKEHYTLCRCGGSRNKPFCDGTHWHIEFRDEKN